jgi:hypothetical protein
MTLDFFRCRSIWVPDDTEAGGFWSPPPPHVKYGVEQIVAHPYLLLADDMGGMKTAQSIIAAQFLHDANLIDTVIVIAPASVRPKVWFDQDLGQLREQVFDDKRNVVIEYHQRVRSWEHGPKDKPALTWYVSNYEFIRNKANLKVLLPYCGLRTLLILDESSAVRTWDSAQTRACMTLRWKTNAKGRPVFGAARCGRILEMNGTPVAESPLDMFSQGNLLHPNILQCRYITHYKAKYAVQEVIRGAGGPLESPYAKRVRQPDGSVKMEKQYLQQTVGWTNLKDLQQRFAPYVLRREAKDLGIDFALPPVGLEVTLTPTTWKYYQEMKREMVVWLKSGVAASATAAVKVIRLAQITSGFLGGVEDPNIGETEDGLFESLNLDGVYGEPALVAPYKVLDEFRPIIDQLNNTGKLTDVRPGVVEIGREKLDFALEWHENLLNHHPNLKLLTWCRFVPELRRYLAEVKRFGHPVGAACGEEVLGYGKKAEREYALRLLHPKTAPAGPATVGATQGTGAMGLNFTACRTVLDISYDFSPWKKKQGDARVNRPGQTGPVSFFYLIAVGPKGQKTIDHHIMLARLGKTRINDWTVSAWVRALTEE